MSERSRNEDNEEQYCQCRTDKECYGGSWGRICQYEKPKNGTYTYIRDLVASTQKNQE